MSSPTHNSNTSEYALFQDFSQSCLLLTDIFNMSICLILSNWLSVLYKNGRRIWVEFMSSLSSSMCPYFLRISLSGVCVDKLFAFFSFYLAWFCLFSFYLAWSDLWESGRSRRTRHASQLSRNVHLHNVFSEWWNLKAVWWGWFLGIHCALP